MIKNLSIASNVITESELKYLATKNHQNTSTSYKGVNVCANYEGANITVHKPHHLQWLIFQHPLAWMNIQIHGLIFLKIRQYPRFSKLRKIKRHHFKFTINCVVIYATVVPISAPNQHSTLFLTIYSN